MQKWDDTSGSSQVDELTDETSWPNDWLFRDNGLLFGPPDVYGGMQRQMI